MGQLTPLDTLRSWIKDLGAPVTFAFALLYILNTQLTTLATTLNQVQQQLIQLNTILTVYCNTSLRKPTLNYTLYDRSHLD